MAMTNDSRKLDTVLMPPPPPKRPRSNCIVQEPTFYPNPHGNVENEVPAAAATTPPAAVSPPNTNATSSIRRDSIMYETSSFDEITSFDNDDVNVSCNRRYDSGGIEIPNSNHLPPLVVHTGTIQTRVHEARNDHEDNYYTFPQDRDNGFMPQEARTSLGAENNSVPPNQHEASTQEPPPPMIKTRFCDIVGHGTAKLRIEEMLLPLSLPPAVTESVLTGIRALPASILLYGPPGCGKTQLARAIAGEAQAAFLSVGPSDVLSKFVGESEASIRILFRTAYERARSLDTKCAVIFFDEIDALGRSRGTENSSQTSSTESSSNCSRQVLAEILIQLTRLSNETMDECATTEEIPFSCQNGSFSKDSDVGSGGCSNADTASMGRKHKRSHAHDWNNDTLSVATSSQPPSCVVPQGNDRVRLVVVAATNRPDDCDAALLRRFAIRVFVGLPSIRNRKKIVSRLLHNVEHTITAPQLEQIANETDAWSGSDLESLTREAAMAPIRECIRAAALIKAKVRNSQEQQQGGDEPAEDVTDSLKTENANEQARQVLLRRFEQLRPVTLEDFCHAICFLQGNQLQESTHPFGSMMFGHSKNQQVHYDSSSDEEGGN